MYMKKIYKIKKRSHKKPPKEITFEATATKHSQKQLQQQQQHVQMIGRELNSVSMYIHKCIFYVYICIYLYIYMIYKSIMMSIIRQYSIAANYGNFHLQRVLRLLIAKINNKQQFLLLLIFPHTLYCKLIQTKTK